MSKVFIERASPLTSDGIASMGCTEEEYNWYVKGLQDGRKLERDNIVEEPELLSLTGENKNEP